MLMQGTGLQQQSLPRLTLPYLYLELTLLSLALLTVPTLKSLEAFLSACPVFAGADVMSEHPQNTGSSFYLPDCPEHVGDYAVL